MKIAQYLPLVQEGIPTMQMQMTIFLEFCAKALAQEGGRLHMLGRHRGAFLSVVYMWSRTDRSFASVPFVEAFSLERISEMALSAMAKIARVYGLK
jgi:hypothetical protein